METFTDKPDPVTDLKVCNATPTGIYFEWATPTANNSEILGYSVFIDDVCVYKGVFENYYEAEGLMPDTCYKILVVAESDRGDGYINKHPHYFRTMGHQE